MLNQRRSVAIGSFVLVAVRLSVRFVDLILMLVLARFLSPRDFGLVAIAWSVVLVVDAALELQVNQALICLPSLEPRHYDTGFTISLLRGLALSGLLLALSYPIARLYDDPRIFALICFLSLAPVTRGLISPGLVRYQKQLNFWRDATIELFGKLVGFTAAVCLALATRSYWAFAFGIVLYPAGMAALSYVIAPYRPRLSLSEFRLFSGFIGWLSAGQIVSAINWQFERLLLGKLRSATAVGFFSTASDISNIPFLALFGPMLRPLLAAFVRLRDDRDRLLKSYQSASQTIVAIGLPLVVGESLLARPTVNLVLGDKWMETVPLVQWLSLSLIPALFTIAAPSLVMAFNETRTILHRNAMELCIKLPLATFGVIEYGFTGLIAARLVSEVAAGLFSMVVVKRLVGLPIRIQLTECWRSIFGTLVMVPVVLVYFRTTPASTGLFNDAFIILSTGVLGAATYAAVLFALWRLTGRAQGPETLAMDALRGILLKLGARRSRA